MILGKSNQGTSPIFTILELAFATHKLGLETGWRDR